MGQQLTRKVERPGRPTGFEAYIATHQVALVVVEGVAAGSELPIEEDRVIVGRGPGADLVIQDDSISRQHVELEFRDDGFRVRDLASTNGTLVNGGEIQGAELKHGDHLQLGDVAFRLVIEERERVPETYELEDA